MSYKNMRTFKIRDWKCFLSSNDYQGFDEIKPINIIIGKNNSGKSKILDFLQEFIQKNEKKHNISLSHDMEFGKLLEADEVRQVFRPGYHGGTEDALVVNPYETRDHYEGIGKYLIGKIISRLSGTWSIAHNFLLDNDQKKQILENAARTIGQDINNPFYGYNVVKIAAERDLRKESVLFGTSNSYNVEPNGIGLTALIVRCLQEQIGNHRKNQELIEKVLLEKINSVLAPDTDFRRIYAKVDGNNQYELFLEEEHKGGIPISDCGSGIKTVLFVMTMLYVVPHFRDSREFMFCFEELENNLHPSLERRLLAHVRDYIYANSNSFLCMTTHSSVAIDLFSKDENSQIIQVKNDGKASYITTANTWNHHNNLLDELGVKASDVLQSNCLVWLEGPSDRVYFKKWIELFNTGEAVEEDLHYQCVFYGGSVLSNFAADPSISDDDLIRMLKINRNAIIIMDSDKSKNADDLKSRVARIVEEAKPIKSILTWVTLGREVENYLPKSIVDGFFEKEIKFSQFDDFAKLYKVEKGVKSFDKVGFASYITGDESYKCDKSLEMALDCL